VPIIAEVAKFCRARQPFCQGATPVPQIALLYSTASHYREIGNLFGRDLSRISGTLQALVESQRVVDVVSEHHLAGRMAQYPLIVIPECDYLAPAFKLELVDYIKKGGNLLVVGPKAAAFFATELGVTLEGAPQPTPLFLACGDTFVATRDVAQRARLGDRTQAVGRIHSTNDAGSVFAPAASIATLGKGKVAATHFSFSRGYLGDRSTGMKSFLNDLVRQLFPKPLVEVSGSPGVDVSVNRLRGRLAINLVNTSGPHWDTKRPLIESIPPVGPLRVLVRTPSKPGKVTLEPGGQQLSFDYRDGEARFTVPGLEIHSVILAE
jgi:hypothetical protein